MRGRTVLLVVLLAWGALASAPARAGELDKVQALAEGGRTEDALRRLEGLLVDRPFHLEGQFLRGVLLAELGRNADAERAFRVLKDRFDRPELDHNLAVLQAWSGRPATAIKALSEILAAYPGYETAARNLDNIRRTTGGGEFDPLSADASRMRLTLTPRLRDFPGATTAQAQAMAPAQALPPPTAEPPVAPVATAPAAAKVEPEVQPSELELQPIAPGLQPIAPRRQPIAARTEPQPAAADSEPAGSAPVPAVPPVEPAAPPAPVAVDPGPAADPSPVEAAPPAMDPSGEVRATISAWAAAWSQQRVKEYLAFYAAEFQPAGYASRAAWEAVRRQRVAAPRFIEVEIELDSMTVRRTGADAASVTFVQHYRSDRYGDTVRKTLDLVREDGAWRIRSENSQ